MLANGENAVSRTEKAVTEFVHLSGRAIVAGNEPCGKLSCKIDHPDWRSHSVILSIEKRSKDTVEASRRGGGVEGEWGREMRRK